MTNPRAALDPAFLASQRARLIALRTDLSRSMDRDTDEARQVLSADQDHANEIEDRAQGLTIAENDRILSSQLAPQRSAIDRALARLDEGTYGFSDVSGAPIPIVRLEAPPQALTTISEEPEPYGGTQLALGVHNSLVPSAHANPLSTARQIRALAVARQVTPRGLRNVDIVFVGRVLPTLSLPVLD